MTSHVPSRIRMLVTVDLTPNLTPGVRIGRAFQIVMPRTTMSVSTADDRAPMVPVIYLVTLCCHYNPMYKTYSYEKSQLRISVEKWVVGGELTSHTQRRACLVQTHIPELGMLHRRCLISRTCTAGGCDRVRWIPTLLAELKDVQW